MVVPNPVHPFSPHTQIKSGSYFLASARYLPTIPNWTMIGQVLGMVCVAGKVVFFHSGNFWKTSDAQEDINITVRFRVDDTVVATRYFGYQLKNLANSALPFAMTVLGDVTKGTHDLRVEACIDSASAHDYYINQNSLTILNYSV